ncbi:DEKNAAC103577 [Brettanomyces naardenensis]|uniref:tRNA dimethylallyltransferase n=1 Tax=Brettanomyces naardenensis TaxID=13370 RepID=A0A448YNB1_BRENA|nr:DEKNAAC103577 [Brettanomyces naardenensis]
MSTIKQRPGSVVSIIGTTGVGKSDLGVALAEALGGEIINADSMQMYKGLPQITNKHPMPERHGIPHHIMDHVAWNEEYHIHRFQKECLAKIDEIHSRGKLPILVGGTHYYLQSVLFVNKTIDTRETQDQEQLGDISKEQKKILDEGSPELLHQLLVQYDPVVAMKFHPHDVRRIKRALEVFYRTGKPASEYYREQQKAQRYESRLRYNTLFLWLYALPEELDKRLDKRVDKMMDQGGLEELGELYEYYDKLPEPKPGMDQGCFQVIGFKEFLPFLEQNPIREMSKEEVLRDPLFIECCEEMKLRTRRYAKRQVKWIRNTLIPDLEIESQHNWCNGGRVYVLNATDLSRWDEVEERGLEIVREFVDKGKVGEVIEQVPEGLESEGLVRSKKERFDESKWVYHTCNICLDKEGKKLVLVGDQYELHLRSRRHKRSERAAKRPRHYRS